LQYIAAFLNVELDGHIDNPIYDKLPIQLTQMLSEKQEKCFGNLNKAPLGYGLQIAPKVWFHTFMDDERWISTITGGSLLVCE
jgi:hypothetical protein